LRFRSNRQTLAEIAERTSGEILPGDPESDKVFERGRAVKRSTKPIFDWFLIALAILVPIDVGLRRVQIDWSTIKGLFLAERRKGPATATMGTLLERKQAVSSELQSRKEERPLSPPSFSTKPPGAGQRPPGAPPKVVAPKPPPPSAAPPTGQPT